MPAVAEPQSLLDQRDAEPGGAGLDRGPGHRDVAVAVAVRLHDRHQLSGLGLEDAGVVRGSRRGRRRPRSAGSASAHPSSTWRDRLGNALQHVARERAFAEVPARRTRPASPWR